jgi:hypothetical protein
MPQGTIAPGLFNSEQCVTHFGLYSLQTNRPGFQDCSPVNRGALDHPCLASLFFGDRYHSRISPVDS